MAIIDEVAGTPAAILLEKAERKEVRKIRDILQQKYERIFQVVFSNPDGLTPQEVADSFGTDAEDFFVVYGGIKQLLATRLGVTGLALPSDYATITNNGDGTVTIVLPEPEPDPV